jgi:hypothetical protein
VIVNIYRHCICCSNVNVSYKKQIFQNIPVCPHKSLLPSSMLEYDSVLWYDNTKIMKCKNTNTCNCEAEERKLRLVHNQRPLRDWADLRRELSQNEMTWQNGFTWRLHVTLYKGAIWRFHGCINEQVALTYNSCTFVGGYQRCGETCYLHITPWRQRQKTVTK